MTTRDVTSASRNLLIIYWIISAFCSYQLGIVLRITANLADLTTFFSRLHVPHDYPNPHGIIPSAVYISEAYPAHLAENPHPHHPHLGFGLPDSMAYG